MEHIFAAQTQSEFAAYQAFVRAIQPRLDAYIQMLQTKFDVRELPEAIVWADCNAATRYISQIPVPAYTNEVRTVITPDLEVWKGIYLAQLEGYNSAEADCIRAYYQTAMSENHILQILGHEFVHQSELFLEDFEEVRDSGIWFEEGMAEYISRLFLLTPEEFRRETEMNLRLTALLQSRYGHGSLEDFGASTYDGSFAAIFYSYWRSFLAVNALVDRQNGDILAVFSQYHAWHAEGRPQTLAQYFGLE